MRKRIAAHDYHSGNGASLQKALEEGKRVVLLSAGPFAAKDVSWQLSVAGRTNGHLATVIADHPLFADFPHNGYCGRQFEHMLNGSRSVLLDLQSLPHRPVLDIASAYKNAHREAMIAEYRVGKGKLLICSLHLTDTDPAACWLKNRILSYGASSAFQPAQTLSEEQFISLCKASPVVSEKNSNEARNKNDITA